jgi:hypothetical protein
MGYLIGIGGSFILAAIVSFLWVFKSSNEESDSDVDYRG